MCANIPFGTPHFCAAEKIKFAINVLVFSCAGWALTSTGQPAANALAVSPPAVE